MLARLADERAEARQSVRAAASAVERLRKHMVEERRHLWGGLLGALRLDEAPLSVQDAATVVARCVPACCLTAAVRCSLRCGCAVNDN